MVNTTDTLKDFLLSILEKGAIDIKTGLCSNFIYFCDRYKIENTWNYEFLGELAKVLKFEGFSGDMFYPLFDCSSKLKPIDQYSSGVINGDLWKGKQLHIRVVFCQFILSEIEKDPKLIENHPEIICIW